MIELYVPDNEAYALTDLDTRRVRSIVDDAIEQQRLPIADKIGLTACGMCVSRETSYFERSLNDYRSARAKSKIAETRLRAQQAGRTLVSVFEERKGRLENEQQERQRFEVNCVHRTPALFNKELTVTIRFQWRKSDDDRWNPGNITFRYDAEPQISSLDYEPPSNFSDAKRKAHLQESLAEICGIM